MEMVLETHNEIDLRRVERKTLLLLVIVTGLALLLLHDRSIGVAVGIGGLISWANFRLLRLIIEGAFKEQGVRRVFLVVLYPLKYLALLGLVFFLIRKAEFNVMAFLVGLSVLLPALLLETIHKALEEGAQEDENVEKGNPTES
ncbi:MAG: ATP synthase subunit I [Deltaproteobacteria bacterium]|nr:MAG: ATP synthase subunit I [Deltaproteobacteria bacterium]